MEPRAGASLIFGSVLMVITMVLHPAGGSFEHLLIISSLIMSTHILALISIPFSLYGFLGLTKKLSGDAFFSKVAFITILLGMFAVMCAAAINGLVMPSFIHQYEMSSKDIVDSIRPILSYNSALNHAFDLVFIGAVCVAITLWSIARVFRTRNLPVWLGCFGICLSLSAIIAIFAGFVFVDLTGFRVFVAGFVIWTIIIGKLLGTSNAVAPIV